LVFAWRYKILLITVVLLTACGNIPRDNPLDPKNPNSFHSKRVLIEAFVNTQNPFRYNEYMITAIDSLYILYPNQLIIAEYHRNTDQYKDPYHLHENEWLYQNYLNDTNSLKGVPDVFINGAENRVQGASSVESALFRLQEVILPQLTQNSYFLLEFNYHILDEKMTPHITLTRLGDKNIENILVKAVLTSQMDTIYHKRIVRGSVKSSLIPLLSHGEVIDLSLPEILIDSSLLNHLIIYITDQTERFVYQSKWISLQQ
jgi:hypothetical protein